MRSLEEMVEATRIIRKDRSSLKLCSKCYRMMVSMEMGVFTGADPRGSLHRCLVISQALAEAVVGSESVSISAAAATTVTSPPIPVTLTIDHYIAKLANMARIEAEGERAWQLR